MIPTLQKGIIQTVDILFNKHLIFNKALQYVGSLFAAHCIPMNSHSVWTGFKKYLFLHRAAEVM